MTSTASAAATTTNTSTVGFGAYWANAPATSAPRPRPTLGMSALSRPASRSRPGGASETMPALSVPMDAPAARPCMIRAA